MPRSSTSGQGRPKGALNKTNRDIKEMIVTALSKAGGVSYLARQANANPVAFMGLVARVLPLQVQGDRNNPLTIKISVEEHRRRALLEIERAFPEPPPKQITVIDHEPVTLRGAIIEASEPELPLQAGEDAPDNVVPLSPKTGV